MAAVLRTAARITQKAQYTDEYAQSNERVKELLSQFEAWIKACKKYLSCLDDLCVQSISLNNYLLEWGDVAAAKFPTFSQAINKVESVNKKVQNERNNLKWRYTKDLVEPLETFTANDMVNARRLKDEFRAIQLQVQTAERFLEDIKKDKSSHKKPSDVLSAEISLAEKQREADRRFILSDNQIKDVLARKEFELEEHFLHLLEAEFTIAESTAKDFKTFESDLDAIVAKSALIAGQALQEAQERDQRYRDRINDRFESRWHELVRMISSPDLVLIQAICSTAGNESDKVLEVLIRILDAHHETLPLIKVGIQKETESTTSEGSLFRGNSTATKLMSAFTRLTGRPYLQSTLRELLTRVQTQPEGYEVDPAKAKGEDVQANMRRLLDTSQEFLYRIMSSLDTCPPAFRYMARILRAEVCTKFPDAKYSSVGGFLFLRFFCPAILAPESCGLALSGVPDAKSRRPLILIAKVLQNLSNNVRFGGKEAFMEPVNEFIDEHLPRLNEFFDQVVSVDEESASEYPPLTNLEEVEAQHLPDIFKRLTDNLDSVVKSLISWKNADAIPHLLEILANLTVILEDPPKPFDTILPVFDVPLSAPYLLPTYDFSSLNLPPPSTPSSIAVTTHVAPHFSPSSSSSSFSPSTSSSSSSFSPSTSSSSSSFSPSTSSPSLQLTSSSPTPPSNNAYSPAPSYSPAPPSSSSSSFSPSPSISPAPTPPRSPVHPSTPPQKAPRIASIRMPSGIPSSAPPAPPKRSASTVFASPPSFDAEAPSTPPPLASRPALARPAPGPPPLDRTLSQPIVPPRPTRPGLASSGSHLGVTSEQSSPTPPPFRPPAIPRGGGGGGARPLPSRPRGT